ncbi:MAG: hypothetical protein ACI83B_003091 [Sediminicola sp.]|jgi:hypothetical protein
MTNYSIDHLFNFWEYIGVQGDFFTNERGYKFSYQSNMSWPSKIFGIDSKRVDFEQLKMKIENGLLPKSLGIPKDELVEKLLLIHNFEKTSVVKGMFLNISREHKPKDNFPTIQRVDTKSKAIEFANVAAKSFGYEIYPKTIISLLNFDSKIRLYLGSHNGSSVSCGIIFLDENKVSGIHMIGTISEYRGRGLGKIMTTKLICEAFNNRSNTVVLVASESGERIYSKMGFKVDGTLSSYSIKE